MGEVMAIGGDMGTPKNGADGARSRCALVGTGADTAWAGSD